MRYLMVSCLLVLAACQPPPPADQPEPSASPPESVLPRPTPRDGVVTDRFATLALDCVHREYPNKISHVMSADTDAQAPRDLHPAFYGCFDWHSSVHGHWLLVRLLNTDPQTPFRDVIIEKLNQSFSKENMVGELAYFQGNDRASYERPYGTAWYLQLMSEIRQSDIPEAESWIDSLSPLESFIEAETSKWLDKLAYPIRLGTHNQSAFAFGLMLDWADGTGRDAFHEKLKAKILSFHLNDRDCPMAYEPSGEDFLSPCLMEADLMRRVMSADDYSAWLTEFLPSIPEDGSGEWLVPGIVLDPADGKLVHLDGVNLSRAWALEGIASALDASDPRRASILAAAGIHKETGIAAVSDEHYSGSHWLASFATYLETQRGIK